MARPESSTSTIGIGQSSITLLQERFRQLRRAKEMREEKKMSKMLAVTKPNINNTHHISSKLHLHPHQFKSPSTPSFSFSSSSSAAAKSRGMMLGFDNVRVVNDGGHHSSSGTSQSRSSTMFLSSSSLSFRRSNNTSSLHHDEERNKEKEKRSFEPYYCDIGKFLQPNINGGDHCDQEVVRQYDIVKNAHHHPHHVDHHKMIKRFDHMGGCDDIDTSLHL